ncbi:DUF1758 domain-containing protein [Trichonephila clavipes]|nr:DUF1758 domain-containing protein [Trichonephila clavipes]
MLPGAEIFYELLKLGKFYRDNLHLVLQNTVFGYVVGGSVDHTQVTENRVHCGLIVDDNLNKTLKKIWEIEGVHIEPKVDTEVSLCENHFVSTHRRSCEGRLSNAPFLAIRTLQQLAKDEKSRFLIASETLLYDTYMDDIVRGAPDLQLQSQLKDILQSCAMNLHKWSSNSLELLNNSLSSDVEHSFSTDIDLSVKT